MEEVKAELLRLVGEKVVEFQEFRAWFGKPWQKEQERCPDVVTAQALSAGGGAFTPTMAGWKVLYSRSRDATASPLVGFFTAKGKRYSKDLVVLSALFLS
ncbi:hypothetical protein M1N59_01365 [Dehalococcoidales bacterium]|nr:hypothetical protein [Dehalococcoidales bacterium]